MAILNLDLSESLAIHQDYEWRATVMIGGNALGSVVAGKLFDRHGGDDLATFRFDPPRFLPDSNKTRFSLFLPANTTRGLPLTGSGYYIYNVRLTKPGKQPILLIAGRAKVLPSLDL